MSSALVERTTTMTGNKKIMCMVCCREMRSDILARHMKQHSSTLQSIAQICKDIVLELVDKVLDMQSASTTKRKFEDNDSDEDLEKEMVRNNIEYKRKITLGKKVYKILGRTDIEQDSLKGNFSAKRPKSLGKKG